MYQFPIIYYDNCGNIISIQLWHKINGQWYQIYQNYKTDKYYTNGKEEE